MVTSDYWLFVMAIASGLHSGSIPRMKVHQDYLWAGPPPDTHSVGSSLSKSLLQKIELWRWQFGSSSTINWIKITHLWVYIFSWACWSVTGIYMYLYLVSSYIARAKLSSQGRFWCWLGLVEFGPVVRNSCKAALANRYNSSSLPLPYTFTQCCSD